MKTAFIVCGLTLGLVFTQPALAQHTGHGDHGGHGDHAASNETGDMLASSTPADGAVLSTSPRSLSLTFTHPVVLQTVAITGPQGPVRGSFRRTNAPASTFAVALPETLAHGSYEARWTATGHGHDMQGVIRFTIGR